MLALCRRQELWDGGAASQACSVAASGPCLLLAPTPVGGAVLVGNSLTITPVAISRLHCDLTVLLIICPVNQNSLEWSFLKSEKMENQSKRGISILVVIFFFQSPKLFFLVFLFNSCINICKKKKKACEHGVGEGSFAKESAVCKNIYRKPATSMHLLFQVCISNSLTHVSTCLEWHLMRREFQS